MSEPIKKTSAPLPSKPGATTPESNPLAAASALTAAKSATPPAPVVAAPVSSPALFGGHKGGGKKRADGLIAGSPAAIETDKAKNAERMRLARAAKKSAEVPPPLPPRVASPAPAPAPLAVDSTTLPSSAPAPLPAPGVAPVNFPTFTPWQQRLLEKPARLLAKIVDRAREFARTKQIKRLKLAPEREKKIVTALKIREEVLNDWSASLAECTAIELNKHQIGGAQHSHWITLAMSTGEIVVHEIETSRLIESLVLEDRAEKNEPPKG
jgi:hypothetical protein